MPPRRGSRSPPAALTRGPIGPYELQAAIAALHDEAQSPEATDWPQVAALYDVLLCLDDNPVVALEAYRAAARAATNLQQQRYLNRQVARLQGRSAS